MNILGPSVAKACRKYDFKPSQLIVIGDSLLHSQGKLQSKFGGKPPAHGGYKSIQNALGTLEFYRLMIGIGRHEGGDAASYVLGRLSSFEKQHWGRDGEGIASTWAEIEKIAKKMKSG